MLVEIKDEFKLGFYTAGTKYMLSNLSQEQLQMIYKNRKDLRHIFNLVEPPHHTVVSQDIESETPKKTSRKKSK